MTTKSGLIRFIVRPGQGSSGPVYVAQCMEYDFAVHGSTLEDLEERLERHLRNQIALAQHLGYEPFTNFKPNADLGVEDWLRAKRPLPPIVLSDPGSRDFAEAQMAFA